MLIEQAIYEILRAASLVTDIVAGRFFEGIAPQELNTYPAVVYRPAGGRVHVQTLEGGCALVKQRIEIVSSARRIKDAALLDEAIIDTLDEFRDTVLLTGSSPQESIFVQGIFLSEPAHLHQYVDKTKLHEFISGFDCDFIDPRRLS